jgi:hypothetical protein
VYALHAARSLKLHVMNEGWWNQRRARLTQTDLFRAADPAPVTTEPDVSEQQPDAVQQVSAAIAPAIAPALPRGIARGISRRGTRDE